jgi:ribosome maturation factor RimP
MSTELIVVAKSTGQGDQKGVYCMLVRDLKTEIETAVEPILTQEGFCLVETKLARFKRNYRVQIFVDSDRGVTIDDCAYLSRLIGSALDVTDIIDGSYILEMSSPGLDRPLHTSRDFRRKIGQRVEILMFKDGHESTLSGMLTGIEDEILTLSDGNGTVRIALPDVRQGKEII